MRAGGVVQISSAMLSRDHLFRYVLIDDQIRQHNEMSRCATKKLMHYTNLLPRGGNAFHTAEQRHQIRT